LSASIGIVIMTNVTSQKIRAFLDSNVLLQYIAGKPELRRLFSNEVRERAAFLINAIVLQEFLLARPSAGDLTAVIPYLEVVDAGVRLSPEIQTELHNFRNKVMHTNNVLILAGARVCDVLLTYDRDLLNAGPVADVKSETPEAFLQELDAAA